MNPLPPLPSPDPGIYYTADQMLAFQYDTIEAVLKIAYEKCTPYGKTGECAWIGIKSEVRHEQKKLLGETK